MKWLFRLEQRQTIFNKKKSLSIENYGFLSEPMPKRKKIIFSIHTSKKKIVEEVFPKVGCTEKIAPT